MNAHDFTFSSSITMTSREIAELTGKRHADVLRDIKVMLSQVNDLQNKSIDGFQGIQGVTVTLDEHTKRVSMISLDKYYADLILDRYRGLARVPYRMQEEAALKTIEQLLGITLIRQYKVCGYRIDGYCIENNTAYEIDEPGHKHKRKEDSDRQQHIQRILGCFFVRIYL